MTVKFQSRKSGPLPMKRGRVIKSIADHTIRNAVDAVVELVTNSDDSYLIAEGNGNSLSGRIDISVTREKGGVCKEFSVRDEALGMDPQAIENSIEFSGETSGFTEGKSVRGFFGRGLKESIIALGKGTILTLKEGVLSRAEIYYDEEKRDAHYNLSVPIANLSPEELLELGFLTSSGTIVSIKVTNDKRNYVAPADTLEDQIADHFALRDINSSPKRKVFFQCEDFGGRVKQETSVPLKYEPPDGKPVFDEEVRLEGFQNNVHFKIFESEEQLGSPRTSFGKAGLLIKTEAAILDNQLFGYETDPAGLYFFGEIICPDIARIIRQGDDSIVDFNRGGLDWDHDYSKKLEEKSKEILSNLIREKREALEKKELTKIPSTVEKMLDKLCRALGELARDELEITEPQPGDIMSLMTVPAYANIELGRPRAFSVYVPQLIADQEGTRIVKIQSSNEQIDVISPTITLDDHKKYSGVLKSEFKIIGRKEGEKGTISAKLGSLIASSDVNVGPQGKRKPKKLKPRGGGIFSKIVPSPEENPIQRFKYEEGGVIKIYVKFPGVKSYLGEGFRGLTTQEGKMLLAEILIEAFSNYVASKKLGREFENEVDRYMFEVNKLKKKCTELVYDIIFRTSLKELKRSFEVK